MERTYFCIDLKSFYASVECIARGLDPMKDNLVVADPKRTRTTICLAVTPAMKALGVRNRCRVFEIPDGIEYVMAKPRMKLYMKVSAFIYSLYLRYVSAEDVHVYSIDECFIDATPYLSYYDVRPREFAKMFIDLVRSETGISATAGIGPNLFLAKVALDVTAKHAPDGIGVLDEESFRREVWFHQPITDIWGIGPGTARRLARYGVFDLAGVASLDPATLHRDFGKNAEYLIDHAWGLEACTMYDIHAYTPKAHSVTNGQVLACDYSREEALVVMREMVEASVLDIVGKGLVCERVSLDVGYAMEGQPMGDFEVFDGGHGKRLIGANRFQGHTGGCRKLSRPTNSRKAIMDALCDLFEETTLRGCCVRRLSIGLADLSPEDAITPSLFDFEEGESRERDLQDAIIAVQGKFGKNAMMRAASLQEKATMRERNMQVGGHRA